MLLVFLLMCINYLPNLEVCLFQTFWRKIDGTLILKDPKLNNQIIVKVRLNLLNSLVVLRNDYFTSHVQLKCSSCKIDSLKMFRYTYSWYVHMKKFWCMLAASDVAYIWLFLCIIITHTYSVSFGSNPRWLVI